MRSPYEFVTYQIERDPSSEGTYLANENRTLEDYRNMKGIDWQDKIFRTAFVHMHNLSVRGGNNSTKYSVSASLNDQDGVIRNSGYKKYQGRITLEPKIEQIRQIQCKRQLHAGQGERADLFRGALDDQLLCHIPDVPHLGLPPPLTQKSEHRRHVRRRFAATGVMNPYISTINENRHAKRATMMANAKLDFKLARH